jgi:phosphoribosylaminoimidazolecarboxamide formyltransferase/IMP cyclohydrolase
MTTISRALVSAYDKTGIGDFARALHERGVQILSTGGTSRVIEEAGVPVRRISDVTGFPEILDGRVKTLHPRIHGGILARRENPSHRAQLDANEIEPIDLVCVNLYPFVETVAREGVTEEEAIEQIDIGGPSMLRAAAKNHRDVLPLVDPADYQEVLRRLDENRLDVDFRRNLATKAFSHTALYDAAVARWLGGGEGERFPHTLVLGAERVRTLRYGENPHQAAALYREPGAAGIAAAEMLSGKPLSYNNLQDAEAAYATVLEFERPAVVVVKHANPCGAAVAADLLDALPRRAWRTPSPSRAASSR